MFTRLAIKNFRAFGELEVADLGPINLFTGMNNAGKTSLLKAIFLLSGGGSPHLAANGNVVRGLAERESQIPTALWKEFFVGLDVGKVIEVAGTHEELGELTLNIESGLPEQVATVTPTNGDDITISPNVTTNVPDGRGLSFSFRQGDKVARGHILLNGPDFEGTRPNVDVPFPAAILVSRGGDVHEDAKRLGELRRLKRGGILLEALRIVEPRLQSIEDNSASGAPMIWGDVGLSELVPLSVMGEGMTRLARIVLAISSSPKGVVLVDEIENGLHHSVLEKVWEVVELAARQLGTQVFATTHSFECVQAAHQALPHAAFRLHRLEIDNEERRCVTYRADAIDGAIKHGLEVR